MLEKTKAQVKKELAGQQERIRVLQGELRVANDKKDALKAEVEELRRQVAEVRAERTSWSMIAEDRLKWIDAIQKTWWFRLFGGKRRLYG